MNRYYAILTHTHKGGQKPSFDEPVPFMSDSDINARERTEKVKDRYVSNEGFYISKITLTDETKKIKIWTWNLDGQIPRIPIPIGNAK